MLHEDDDSLRTPLLVFESRTRDADISAEASKMARLTVPQQAGMAALAQEDQTSQALG